VIVIKAALVFAAILLLIRRALPAGHPFARFGPANSVTTLRAAMVSLIAGFIGEPPTSTLALGAVAMTFVITALDGVDGALARRSGLASTFGARFDMEVDALLVMVLSILVWQHGKAGVWITMAGLWRYLFVAAGALFPWLAQPLFPSVRRKAICVVLIVGLGALLLPAVTPPLSTYAAAALLATVSYSFLADTVWLWQRGQ
jgi:phosphatidylglycerophosphate synthase